MGEGILLCRRHHLLLRDHNWDVIRNGANYALRPPATIDPEQALIPLLSKNPIIKAMITKHAAASRPKPQ